MSQVKRNATEALTIQLLSRRYRSGVTTPTAVIEECLSRIKAHADPATWITLFEREAVMAQAHAAEQRNKAGEMLPLLGIPFAVKDNIDIAGIPTTAACPDFMYVPQTSATVVGRLLQAGAIAIGKTNLDQFATGLVGVRSPYGTPRNPFNADFIPGGSSSGSATAVSAGLVSFALGTDTAGSGRVPAGFNNVVGFKPTRGRLSTAGVVPACRSLDCVSVFALTCADAAEVTRATAGHDPSDPFSRTSREIPARPTALPNPFRFGIPCDEELDFFGNGEVGKLFREAASRLQALGGIATKIDFKPFREAGALLYNGPWISERLAGLGAFVSSHGDSLLPTTLDILKCGEKFSAPAVFDGMFALRKLHHLTMPEWAKMDVLLLPTAGAIYTLAQVAEDPQRLNSNLGLYTTFTNLLDLCAVAVPGGFLANGLPMGVTLMAQAGNDGMILGLGDRLHRSSDAGSGTARYSTHAIAPQPPVMEENCVRLAVVGAHLSGQPLNWQLTDRGGRMALACRTGPDYRLYALANTSPPKPGLARVLSGGTAIEVEVWELTPEAFGDFVADVPPPMVIGTVTLDNGKTVKGFLCEPCALEGARDITSFGGWRSFLRQV